MYIIENHQENNIEYIVLKNLKTNSEVKLSLNQGGSLQKLTIDKKEVIIDLSPLKYEDTYASSILFPFANRINNGTYIFDGVTYNLDCNEIGNNNALHGLVYNKYFTCVESHANSDYATVTLEYEEINKTKGFPFKYKINLIYKLSKNQISLTVSITNLDSKTFPFTLGWHPYFTSSDLFSSKLEFNCNKKIAFDEKLITKGTIDFKEEMPFEVKDKKLDDCFILNDNLVVFETPSYNLKIESTSKENFLQLYTPSKLNTIAIEPTIGVSDSFNNNIGLQQLHANETYKTEWLLTIS